MVARSKKGVISREAMVLAAKRLFATQGYPRTSIQQIADAVGVSQSAVMHYFPTKLDVFTGVLEEMIVVSERLREEHADPTANALELLLGHFDISYRWAVDCEHHAQIMTGLFHFATYDPSFTRIYTAHVATARGRILALLHAGAREKLFALPDDPDGAAALLHDGLLGMLLTLVACERPPSARRTLFARWQRLLAGITGLADETLQAARVPRQRRG